METAIDIPAMAGIIFSVSFLLYGWMSLAVRPYESPLYVAEEQRNDVNKRYIQSRRLLAVVYSALGIAAWFVIPLVITATGDSGVTFVSLTCVNLFFALHAEVLTGLCSLEAFAWRKSIAWIVPLVVLCGICLFFPQTAPILEYIQLFILLLLVGYYTPLFFRQYANLTSFCKSAVGNEQFDLPERMPWISRLYVSLLMLTILAAVCCFTLFGWHTWLLLALYIVYIVRFMSRILFTYTLYSKMIKRVMG